MIQWLLDHNLATVEWLIPFRLILGGLVILLTLLICKKNIWIIWTEKSAFLQISLYGIAGILGLQYSFMNAIANGTAVNATLFQFLGPILIAAYIALRVQRLPASIEWISMFAAFLGIFLVVTGGTFQITSFSAEGVLWGGLTALTFAFYTIYPIRLLQKWGPALTSGWGMLIGGIFFGLFGHSLNDNALMPDDLDTVSLLLIGFIIFFGTGLAFFLYISSLRYLKPLETSILTSVEPLTTILLSVLWLAQPFVLFQSVGGLLIIGSTILLTISPRTKRVRASA
jgi:drug/metabolite transporter (DMT)-like permease